EDLDVAVRREVGHHRALSDGVAGYRTADLEVIVVSECDHEAKGAVVATGDGGADEVVLARPKGHDVRLVKARLLRFFEFGAGARRVTETSSHDRLPALGASGLRPRCTADAIGQSFRSSHPR